MNIAPRRTMELAVLVWSAILLVSLQPLPCQSFSFPSNAAQTKTAARRPTLLHAVQEREATETVATTIQTTEALSSIDQSESSQSVSSLSSPLSSISSLFPDDRQVLKFVEPTTNVTVVLIGSMHYNPASIALVERTVENLGATNQLGSVIIESCDIRWNKTQELMDKKKAKKGNNINIQINNSNNGAEQTIESSPNDKDFLGNEMRAAWEVATKYKRPTVLGDQRINITIAALKSSVKETAQDLFLKGPEGWKRTKDEIAANWETTIPINGNSPNSGDTFDEHETRYLNAFAFFDPRLLISLPVSLVKYPLSFLIKDPIPVGTVFAIIAALNFYGDGGSLMDVNFSLDDLIVDKDYTWKDYAGSVAVAVLETVVFARLLLKPLLADRNEILAKSVLDQCLLYENGSNGGGTTANGNGDLFGGWFQNLLKGSPQTANDVASTRASTSTEPVVYVPGSDPESMLVAEQQASSYLGSEGKVVVAVLGMAHCNGVMKLLREQKV